MGLQLEFGAWRAPRLLVSLQSPFLSLMIITMILVMVIMTIMIIVIMILLMIKDDPRL